MRIPTWKAALLVALGELRGSFRDKQTLVYSVVLPICMYPVLFWVMVQGALLIQGRREHSEVRVGLAAARTAQLPDDLADVLARAPGTADEESSSETPASAVAPVRIERASRPLDAAGARDWLAQARSQDRLDAVLWVAGRDAPGDPPTGSQLFYDGADGRSKLARQRVEQRLAPYLARIRDQAAQAQAPRLVPFEVQEQNVAPQRDMLAYMLSFLLPMLLVIMCVIGAFFPAVDVTAGEKERATAETTLLLPVPRSAVHQGKILSVCVASVLATTLNLGALGLSAGHLLSMVSSEFGSNLTEIPILSIVAVMPLAVLFAFFVSAVLVGISSLASSFKEGQALLGPVQMVFMLPAMAGVLPGLELSIGTAFLPVVNVVLAFRCMLQGTILPVEYSLVGLSLLFYALLAIRLALRLLAHESVQLSSETLPLTRLWSLLRSPRHAR